MTLNTDRPDPIGASQTSQKSIIERRPGAVLAAAVAAYVALWWLAQVALSGNLPMDMVEHWTWGRYWQLVYYNHPPLPAWVMAGIGLVSGYRPAPLYLAAPIFVAVTVWAVWRLGVRTIGPLAGALGALSLAGSMYYGFNTQEFNHNVAQYPFFALLPLALHRALNEDRRWDWALVGLLAGFGLYAKYSVALLIVSAALFILIHPRARWALRGPGPYIAAGLGLLAVAPHLWALWDIDFLPFRFPLRRAAPPESLLDHVINPARFLAAQIGSMTGTLVLAACLLWPRRSATAPTAPPASAFDRAFLIGLGFGPIALALAIDIVTGLKFQSMWGSAMFPLLGLALLAIGRPVLTPARLRLFAVVCIGFFVLNLGGYAAKGLAGPWLRDKASRMHFPGPALAAAVESVWAEAAPGRPLRYVVGLEWDAGNVAFYGQSHPDVFIRGLAQTSPWIDPDDMRRQGAVFLWEIPDWVEGGGGDYVPAWADPWLDELCPGGTIELPWQTWATLEPVRVRYAFLGEVCAGRSQ